MHHLIGYAVVARTSMDEYAGCVTKLPASLVGEHREESMVIGGSWSRASGREWLLIRL